MGSPWHGNEVELMFVLLTWLLSFLVTKRSRVLKKKVNESQVSETVFSHLNHVLANRLKGHISGFGRFWPTLSVYCFVILLESHKKYNHQSCMYLKGKVL